MHDTWESLNRELLACERCPRLVAYRQEIARTRRRAYRDWDYWGRPVPGFGDPEARLLIIGLAPGAHGSNRTGRMFTGDSSGETLYAALYRAGFANRPTATAANDGLELRDAFITAVGRCAPPGNRPTRDELLACRPFLLRELALLRRVRVVLALGRVAFEGYADLLRSQGEALPRLEFAHGAVYPLPAPLPLLVASYHPSRQNTQTGRLTPAMLDEVFARIREQLREETTDHARQTTPF